MINNRERFWHRHHSANGRKLGDHPAAMMMKSLISIPSDFYSDRDKRLPRVLLTMLGGIMDVQELAALICDADAELKEVSKQIEETYNKLGTVATQSKNDLDTYIKEIRATRMAAAVELTSMLSELRAVRSFFKDQDFNQEMQQVERFIKAAKEIQQLRESGVLDAILQAAIKLEEKSPK